MVTLSQRQTEETLATCGASQVHSPGIQFDLSKDTEVANLYREHPYFADVLSWMNGQLEYRRISHFYSDFVFRTKVLPQLNSEMERLGLVTKQSTSHVPTFRSIELVNVPDSVHTNIAMAEKIYHGLIYRVMNSMGELKVRQVRTRVSPEVVSDLLQKIEVLVAQLESHYEPSGEPFSICYFSSEGA